MRKVLYAIVLVVTELMLLTVAVNAQTLSPVFAEGGRGRLSGQFDVSNNGLIAAPATVQAVSFDVREGHAVYRNLDPTVHAVLEQSSARLSPRSSHTFYFSLTCDVLPCNVAFMTALTIGKTAQGLQVRAVLPFHVYVCAQSRGCRAAAIK